MPMDNNNLNSETVLPELYFLIAHFLKNSPFRDTAHGLIEQMENWQVLPSRIDWRGVEHARSFQEFIRGYNYIPCNFLLQMCNQLRFVMDNQLQNRLTSFNTLLGNGQYSLLQDVQKIGKKALVKTSNLDALPKDFYCKYTCLSNGPSVVYNYSSRMLNGSMSMIVNLNRLELGARLHVSNVVQPEFYRSVNLHKRILGHLTCVYCICFDRTGRFILTGADDNLIKAWSATDGRLMATFRGHDKEISDIDINFENTLLASGSCDKMIRIWNLKTTESTTVLQTHLSMVTNVEFSPYCKGTVRWLASSGNDGLICFWQWNSKTLAFNPKPKKFIEKSRPGTQMLCLSFSPGGLFMAAGSNDNAIRVYYFDKDEPKKVGELESHTNWVDSIQFANLSARFLSGSKDGTARIWKYENSKFNAIFIDGSKTLQKTEQNEFLCSDNFKRHNVTMVAWNCDDTLVITAQSNFIIKVWNSDSAELIHELKGHQDEIYVLEAHPRDARIILSASHDGYIILWNILAGKMIRKFYNKIDNEGHASNFDTKWSPSLELFATTDSHGSLSIYGFGTDENYKKVPHEQFFHTDYRPLMGEPNSFVVDEQTQQPPHLMPPPFLVNAEGNPYSAEYQRLVPGRENLTNAQLIPNVITHENGISEIIGDRDAEDETDDRPNADEAPARTRTRLLWLKNLIRPLDERTLSASESTRLEKLKLEEKESLDGIRAMDLSKNQSILFQFKENESTTERREMRNGGAGTSGGTATRRGGRARRRENGASSTSAANRNNLFDADFFDDESMHRIRPEYDENTLEDGFVDIVDEDSNTQHSTGANPSMSNMLQAMIGRQGSRASHPHTSSNMNNSHGETNNLPGTSGFGGAGNTRQSQPEERFVDMVASESDSSEYSDWAEEEGGRVLKPPTQRKSTRQQRSAQQRRKTKRVLKIVRDDEEDAQNSDNEHTKNSKSARLPTRTSSRRAKKIVSEDDDSSDKDDEVVIKSVGSKKNTDSKATNLSTDIDEEMNEDSGSNDSNDSSSQGDDDDDDDDERMDDDTFTDNDEQPCTSHAATSRSSTSKSPRKRGRPSGKHKVNSKLNKQLSLKGNLKECDPSFRPPEWLTSTKPKKSPYMPQVNDEVVYFRQGHELYVNEVKLKNEYEIEEKSLPWIKHKNRIGVQEFCLVINMKIEIKPPRLVCLRLKIVSGASAGTEFTIKYHDMAHVVDFVVLKQFYERGMEHNWKPNDRFKCIIDDIWYVGQIESKKPLDELYPDSPFQCLCVNWQTGESEQFSPWDLEPVCGVNSRKSKCPAQTDPPINGEQVTLDEMKSLLYVPNSQEWPTLGRDYECERILTGLKFIMDLSIAEYFNFPVDLDAFPAYAQVIGYPIDLNTIKERLENRYYRRFKSILWDIRKIQENAVAFNEPKSDIVTRAIQLTKVLYEFINDHDCFNPKPIYRRICKKNSNNDNSILNQNVHEDDDDDEDDDEGENVENTTLDESTGVRGKTRSGGGYRTLRRKANFNAPSLKFNLRSSSRIGGSGGSNSAGSSKYFDDKSWYDPVKKILDEMLKKEISHPFRQPVDTKTYRDYLDIIDEPMDLGTIRKRLSSKYYGSDIHKLDSECRLVFSNSKTYNTDKHSKIYDMTSRLEAFYLNRMHPILKKYDHLRKKPAPTSRMRRTRFDYDQLSTFKSEESFEQPSHGKASASASASSSSKITQQQSKYFASRSDLYDDQNANAGYSTRSSGRRSTKNYANESNAQTNYDRPTTSKSIKEEYVETDEYDDENDQTPSDDDNNVEYDLNDSKANIRERATSSTEQSTLANNHLEKKASLTSLLVESLAADEPPSRKTNNNNNRVSQNNSETAVSFNDALCDDSNDPSEQKSNQKPVSSSSKTTTVRKAQKRKSNNVYNERDDYDDDEDDDDHNDVDEQSDSDYEQETINQKKKNARTRSNRSNNHIEKHEDEQKDETGSTNYEEDENEDDDVEEEEEESTGDDEEEEDDDEDNRTSKYNNKKSTRSNKKSKSKNKKVTSVRKSKSKMLDEEEEEEEEEEEDDDDDDDDYEDENNHHESKKKATTKKSKRHSSASLRAAANMDNKENDNKQFNQRQMTKNNHQQPTSKRLLNSSSNASLSTRSSRRTKRQCYREFSSSDNDDLDSPALSDEHETTYVKNKKSLNGTTGTDAGGSSKKARIAAPSHDEEEANHGFENLNGHTSHSFDYSNHNHHNENSLGAASTSNGNQQSLFKLSSRGRIVKTVSLRDS